MLKLKKYTPAKATDSPCIGCPIFMLCTKCINEDCTIKPIVQTELNSPIMSTQERNNLVDALSLAIKCKKQYPNAQIKNEQVTQYVLVGKTGREISRSNGFWAFIGSTIGTVFLAIIFIMIIAGICSMFG